MKKKSQFNFLKVFFDNPLSKNLISKKELLAYISWLGLLTKIKKGSGTSFWSPFPTFFHKIVRHLKLYQLTKFQYQTYFPSQGIKQYVFLCSYLANWWRYKLEYLSRGKRGGEGNTKYLNNEKRFLDEIKNIFHNF